MGWGEGWPCTMASWRCVAVRPGTRSVHVPSNLPICQSQIGQPICKWDDQSENLLEVPLISNF